MNLNPMPCLAHWVAQVRIVIATARGHRRDRVPCLDQSQGQVAEVLRRRDIVGLEALVEQKDTHVS